MRRSVASWWLFILAIGVLLLAPVLRLWLIAHLLQGLYSDESFHLLRAQEIVRGQALPVLTTGSAGYEPLFVYLQPIVAPVTHSRHPCRPQITGFGNINA